MPQPKKAARFGGSAAHHNMILANLATELSRQGRIETSLAQAKTVQPLAERMVTFAKRGDVHARRQVLTVIRDKDVVHKLFADIGPVFSDRHGGYTRVLKLGPRRGDNAPMALIDLVEIQSEDGEVELTEEPRRRWSLRRRRGTVSTTAREREEDRAAALDRGEELEDAESETLVVDEPEPDPEAEAPEPETAGSADADDTADEAEADEGPQVNPAEVEARLAAQEEAEAASEEPSEDTASDEDEDSDK